MLGACSTTKMGLAASSMSVTEYFQESISYRAYIEILYLGARKEHFEA
jgi:hypothetical protein